MNPTSSTCGCVCAVDVVRVHHRHVRTDLLIDQRDVGCWSNKIQPGTNKHCLRRINIANKDVGGGGGDVGGDGDDDDDGDDDHQEEGDNEEETVQRGM